MILMMFMCDALKPMICIKSLPAFLNLCICLNLPSAWFILPVDTSHSSVFSHQYTGVYQSIPEYTRVYQSISPVNISHKLYFPILNPCSAGHMGNISVA